MANEEQLDELFALAKMANRYGPLERHLPTSAVSNAKEVKGMRKVKIKFEEVGRENILIQELLHRSYGL